MTTTDLLDMSILQGVLAGIIDDSFDVSTLADALNRLTVEGPDPTPMDETDPTPMKTDPTPDESDPNPDESDPNPDESDPTPMDETDPTPDESDPTPDESDPTPDESDPTPDDPFDMRALAREVDRMLDDDIEMGETPSVCAYCGSVKLN